MPIAFMGARGGGRLHELTRRYGWKHIILEGIRLKVRFPLWKEIDEILERYMDWMRFEEQVYWLIRNGG